MHKIIAINVSADGITVEDVTGVAFRVQPDEVKIQDSAPQFDIAADIKRAASHAKDLLGISDRLRDAAEHEVEPTVTTDSVIRALNETTLLLNQEREHNTALHAEIKRYADSLRQEREKIEVLNSGRRHLEQCNTNQAATIETMGKIRSDQAYQITKLRKQVDEFIHEIGTLNRTNQNVLKELDGAREQNRQTAAVTNQLDHDLRDAKATAKTYLKVALENVALIHDVMKTCVDKGAAK